MSISYTIPTTLNLFFAPDSHRNDDPSAALDMKGTSKAVQTLWQDTKQEHLDQVLAYVRGKAEFSARLITRETVFSYLAAAKIVDLTLPLNQQENSTILIRDLCFREPETLSAGKQLTLINTYSVPKLDEESIENANRLDALDRAVRLPQEYLSQEISYHRDAVRRIHAVYAKAMKTIEVSTQLLSKNGKHLYFTGASGSGKTHGVTKLIQSLEKGISPPDVIYRTDSFKEYLKSEDAFPGCGDFQSFLMAIALRKKMESHLKTGFPEYLFLQEGILMSEKDLKALFLDTKAPVEISDSDAPFRTIALRILNRALEGKGVYATFETARTNVTTTREARPLFGVYMRSEDSYSMHYDGVDYSLDQMKEMGFKIPDQNMDEVGNDRITEADVAKFGEKIFPYLGMTIRDAMNQAVAASSKKS